MDDLAFCKDIAQRLGVGFMVRDLTLGQIKTTMLGFMHGKVPASVDAMRTELENSYASLLVDVEGKLSREDEERLLSILRR